MTATAASRPTPGLGGLAAGFAVSAVIGLAATVGLLGVLRSGSKELSTADTAAPSAVDPLAGTSSTAAASTGNAGPATSVAGPATVTTVVTTATVAAETSLVLDGIYAAKASVDGEYVAVVWSAVGKASTSATDGLVSDQRDERASRLGVELIALDGDDFGSLRDGTVALAYRGKFADARLAAQWCVSNNLNSGVQCFGVVLSDAYDETMRGDQIRVYP